MALSLHERPEPGPRLSRKVLAVLGGVVLLLIGGVIHLQARLRSMPPAVVAEEPAPPLRQLPDPLRKAATNYAELAAQQAPDPPARPPTAQFITQGIPVPAPVVQQSLFPSVPQIPASIPTTTSPANVTPAHVPNVTPAPPPKPEKKRWGFAVEAKREPPVVVPALPPETRGPSGGVEGLLQPANWVIPAEPLKTLYRSMLLPGQLDDAINSDIPAGTIRIHLSIPIFDKFGYNTIILDKGSKVIAEQAGKPEFGQARLPLKISQIELPTGEIIGLDGMVGDVDGAAGVPGKVDAHTGKLLLATGINAVLNIGVRTIAGTPGRGQFYQDPIQGAAGDVGQSVASDAKRYTDQVLKVAPTIKASKGDAVSITLTKNLQFNRKPVVIR